MNQRFVYRACLALSIVIIAGIEASLPLRITNISTQPETCTGDDGIIVIAATGPVQFPIRYSIDNGENFQASPLFEGVAAGTYNIIVSNNQFPDAEGTATVEQVLPLAFTDVVLVGPDCPGESTGSITVEVTGGRPPIFYHLDRVILGSVENTCTPVERIRDQASNVFENLQAGRYVISVTSADNCLVTDNPASEVCVELKGPDPIFPTTRVDSVACNNGTDGAIIISAITGGTPPYIVSFNGQPFQAFPEGGLAFTGLKAGDYTIVIRDSLNCQTETTLTVTQPTDLVITDIIPTNVTCNGFNDGTLTVVTAFEEGKQPFEYVITPPGRSQASPVFTDLAPGQYQILALAEGTCAEGTAVITEPPALACTTTVKPADCISGKNGSVTVKATGGTPGYLYSSNGGRTFQESNVFSLPAGTYTIVVKDENGCTKETKVTVDSIRGMTGNPITDFITVKYCNNRC